MASTSIMSSRRRVSRPALIPALVIALTLGLGTSSSFGAGVASATSRPGTAAVVKFSTSAAGTTFAAPISTASTQAGTAPELAYALAEADGSVEPVGGAAFYGSAFGTALVAPIVATVSTPDRKGYWLFGADGSVYPFGDAHNEGGAGARCCRARSWPPRRLPTAPATGS